MNVLPRDKQISILSHLVEGSSVRSTERLVGVCREAVLRLLVRVGSGCANLLDETMVNLPCKRLEIDELWLFIQKKQRHVTAMDGFDKGDVWTYAALDPETKLIPAFMTGKRTEETTRAFIKSLAPRFKSRVQISTDGMRMYADAIGEAFDGAVDYAQVTKTYEADAIGPGRYSPPEVVGVTKEPIFGAPIKELASTSMVECQNRTIRMGLRRFTRLTNGHSKKLENHGAAVALWFAYYNYVRIHSTIRCTPAMAAGVSSTAWDMGDLLDSSTARIS